MHASQSGAAVKAALKAAIQAGNSSFYSSSWLHVPLTAVSRVLDPWACIAWHHDVRLSDFDCWAWRSSATSSLPLSMRLTAPATSQCLSTLLGPTFSGQDQLAGSRHPLGRRAKSGASSDSSAGECSMVPAADMGSGREDYQGVFVGYTTVRGRRVPLYAFPEPCHSAPPQPSAKARQGGRPVAVSIGETTVRGRRVPLYAFPEPSLSTPPQPSAKARQGSNPEADARSIGETTVRGRRVPLYAFPEPELRHSAPPQPSVKARQGGRPGMVSIGDTMVRGRRVPLYSFPEPGHSALPQPSGKPRQGGRPGMVSIGDTTVRGRRVLLYAVAELGNAVQPQPSAKTRQRGRPGMVCIGDTTVRGRRVPLYTCPEPSPAHGEAGQEGNSSVVAIGETTAKGHRVPLYSFLEPLSTHAKVHPAARPDTLSVGGTTFMGRPVPLFALPEEDEPGPSAPAAPAMEQQPVGRSLWERRKPSKQQLMLNERLMLAESVEEVVGLVAEHHSAFDAVNVSTALGRLNLHGAMASSIEMEGEARDTALEASLRLLIDELLGHAHRGSIGARQMANAAHALAGMGAASEEFFGLLSQRLVSDANSFRPQELAMSLRALVLARLPCNKLPEAIAAEIDRRVEDFNTQEMAIISWSLAKMRLPAPRVFSALAAEGVSRAPEFTFQELANIAWACSRVRQEAPELLEAVAFQATQHTQGFKTEELAMVAWALSFMQHPNDNFFVAAIRDVLRRPEEYSAHSLSRMLWAATNLQYETPELLAAVASQVAARVDEFRPLELARIAWAFASQGEHAPHLFAIIEEAVAPVVSSLRFRDASMLAWAFAASQAQLQGGLFQELAHKLPARVMEGNPYSWVMLLWAFASARHSAPELFLEVAPLVLANLGSINIRWLSMLAYAYACVNPDCPESPAVLRAIGEAAAERCVAAGEEERMGAQDLSLVLWSMAAVGVLKDSGQLLHTAARTLPFAQLNQVDRVQLFQADLAAGGALLQGGCLHDECRQAWLQEAVHISGLSDTAIEVSDSLMDLGLGEHRLGSRTADGLLTMDIELKVEGVAVAVEVDGPARLCANPPHLCLGKTRFKQRLLEDRGLVVLSVPFHEWEALPSFRQRKEYLQAGLLRCISLRK